MFQVLIIIDDFADNPQFSRNSKILHALYTRGRHSFISTITATQVLVALSPIIRKNATEIYVYKLRNYKDLESLLEAREQASWIWGIWVQAEPRSLSLVVEHCDRGEVCQKGQD
jgi:hypothetical protein